MSQKRVNGGSETGHWWVETGHCGENEELMWVRNRPHSPGGSRSKSQYKTQCTCSPKRRRHGTASVAPGAHLRTLAALAAPTPPLCPRRLDGPALSPVTPSQVLERSRAPRSFVPEQVRRPACAIRTGDSTSTRRCEYSVVRSTTRTSAG